MPASTYNSAPSPSLSPPNAPRWNGPPPTGVKEVDPASDYGSQVLHQFFGDGGAGTSPNQSAAGTQRLSRNLMPSLNPPSYSDVDTIYRKGRDDVGGYGVTPGAVQVAGGNTYSGNATMLPSVSPSGYSRPSRGIMPSLNPPNTTAQPAAGNATGPTITPSLTSPFGSRQQIALAIRAKQAADRIRANPLQGVDQPQPLRFSEDAARTMYSNLQQSYPGQNVDNEFINRMTSRGQDGAAMLKTWATGGTLGQPVAEYQQATPGNKGIPVSELGPSNSAGTSIAGRIPGLAEKEQGMYIGGTPATPAGYGPGVPQTPGSPDAPLLPSVTPPTASASAPAQAPAGMLPSTSANGWSVKAPGNQSTPTMMPSLTPPSAAPITNGTPPTVQPGQVPTGWTPEQAAWVTRERLITADNLDSDAQARSATIPPTQREQFNAGTDVAETAAAQPAAVAGAKAQSAQNVAQTNATGKVSAAQAKGLSDQEVAKIRAEGRPASLGKQAESPDEKSLNDRYVAATERSRAALQQYAASKDPADQAKVDQAYKDMFDAQKMREDYYSQFGSAPSQPGPAASPQTAPAPQQTPAADQSGDQVYQGFRYRVGQDGQYHKVGPA